MISLRKERKITYIVFFHVMKLSAKQKKRQDLNKFIIYCVRVCRIFFVVDLIIEE